MGHGRRKRAWALALCAILPLMALAGCDYVDIDQLVSVIGIGVDYRRETGTYLVTAEIANILEGGENTLEAGLLSGEGLTLARALEDMATKASGRLYYQHADIVIFGEETASFGIAPVIDSVMRAAHSQKVIKTLVAKGATAAEMFAVKPGAKMFLSNEIAEAIVASANRFGASDEGRIHNLYNDIPAGLANTLPVVRIDGEGKDASFTLDGVAVMSGGKLCGFLSYEETKYCMLAMGQLREGFIMMRSEKLDELFTLEITSAAVRCAPILEDGALTMRFEADVVGIVPEIGGQTPTVEEVKEYDLAEDIRRQLKAGVEEVAHRVVTDFGADLFYFRPQVENRYRRRFAQWQANWPDVLRAAAVKVDIRVSISSNGITR